VRSLRVALTGGIATGKTTVLQEFARLGARTVSADEVAHEVLADPRLARRVARLFGPGVLGPGGRVDRRALGRVVFSRPRALAALERLTHPLVLRRMEALISRGNGRAPVVVADVPLLFEKGLEGRFDLRLVVWASRADQLRRLRSRDGLGAPEARRRLALQWPVDAKARRADAVLDNSRPWSRVRPEVREVYEALRLLSHGARRTPPAVGRKGGA